MKKTYPLRYLATAIWIGFILGISFLEAPLKFQAPSVSLSIGLEIGKLVFNALNKVEWILLLLVISSLLLAGTTKIESVLVGSIALILIIQSFYLLPKLNLRIDLVLAGNSSSANSLHFYYVGLEVVKVLLLFITSIYFIYAKSNVRYNSI